MYYTYPKNGAYPEFFKGTRYARSDFAGWYPDYNEVLKAVAYLNGESKEGFTVHMDDKTLKDLKVLTDELSVTPQKLSTVPTNGCPHNPSVVTDMFTVTYTSQI
jgi:hypothetical protein